MKKIILFLVLLIFIIGCAEKPVLEEIVKEEIQPIAEPKQTEEDIEQFLQFRHVLGYLIINLVKLAEVYASVEKINEILACAKSITEAGSEVKKVDYAIKMMSKKSK